MAPSEALRGRIATARSELWADGRGPILLTISVGWLVTLGVRIVYPALLPGIMSEFGVGYTGGGVLLSTMWVSYALVQFPGGIAADWVGEQRVILGSVAGSLVAVLAIVFAPTYGVFVAATVLLGLGAGFYGTSRVTIVTDVFPDHKTTAVSFTQASGNVGNAVLPVVAGLFAVAFGWRVGFGYLVPIFLLVIAGVLLYIPTRTSAEPDVKAGLNRTFLAELRGAVLNRNVILMTLLLLVLMAYYQGMTGFLPTYLIDVKGLSQPLASAVYGAFFVTAILLQFVSGIVSDRYGQRRTIALFVLIGLPAAVALPVVDSRTAVIPLTLATSGVLAAIPPAHTYAVDLVPDALQGSGYGMVRTLYIGAAAGAPPIVGRLADSGRFDLAIASLGAVTLVAVLLCVVLPKTTAG
jgi:MFS family permease